MKINLTILIITSLFIIGCNSNIKEVNQFTSTNDKIVLKTKKIKGFGMFPAGAGQVNFYDTTEKYLFPVIFPDNITNIKLAWQFVDYQLYQLEDRRNTPSEYIKFFLKTHKAKIDSLSIPTIEDNYIPILTGQLGKDTVFIIDENNNKDFRDDSVRLYREMDWHTTSDLIKCKYNIFDGDKMSVDSTWINIGTLPYRNNDLFLYVSHHLVSTFSIDDQKFQIGVHDGQNKFCFQHPLVAIISENGLRKDSLPKTDLLKEGEYLKLGDRYYRFEDVSNGGKFITLIKEDDVSNKTGTQVGFKALDFKCVSMTGDSIELRDFNNEYLLITNVTSCYSKPSSYIHYKDLTDEYKDRIDFLCLDKSPIILNNNIKGLNLNGIFINVNENKELEKYRLDFCSRTCFLINPEGQIIDKFEIRDWKNALEKHFTIH